MGSDGAHRDLPAVRGEAHGEPLECDHVRRETAVAARENAVTRREAAVAARETAHAERMHAAHAILAAADARDRVSDARDVAAEKRENDRDRADMLNPASDYGAHWPEWRCAQHDREHAKGDRIASRHDRIALTDGDA